MSPGQWQLSQRAKLCELVPMRKVVVELWLLGTPDWCKVLANFFDAAKIVLEICHCPGSCLGVEHGWNSLWICILWISTSAVNSIQILSACSGHRRKDRQDPERKRWGGKNQTGGKKANRRKWLLNFKVQFNIKLYSSTPGGKTKVFSKLKQKCRSNLESDGWYLSDCISKGFRWLYFTLQGKCDNHASKC